MSKDEIKNRVREMVAYARSLCADIEFSTEDGGRTEADFLHEVLDVAISAGATTLNIPDTVGYTLPSEYAAMITGIRQSVKDIDSVILSVHCHDDLGLAAANSLAGILAGARQAEVTINGIGERAGNASLEEVVMTLNTRRALFGLRTGIDTTQLVRASRLVSTCTGISVQPNKAIVGANAFAHESGIHQDGMLKHNQTYEIMRPETVGAGQTLLVLGKHSGRHAFSARLQELGYHLEHTQLDQAFEHFKQLADRKKQVTDADIEALISSELYEPRAFYTLDGMQVSCGTIGLPTATVRLRSADGTLHVRAVVGTGPVDAAFKAIDSIVALDATLLEFSVRSITAGIDALGEVTVHIRADVPTERVGAQRILTNERVIRGHGADTDIVVASVKAYLAALNRLLALREAGQEETKPEAPRPAPTAN